MWNDEFSGDQMDGAKWSHETNCWGGGNNEQQCYTDRPENSFLRDGAVVIHAREETFTGPAQPTEWAGTNPHDTATLPYTSARMRTLNKGDFTYGRIEVRAQLPGGQGRWPAIWVLPQEMAVDYVRVFSCPASPTTLDACATPSPDAEAVAGNQPPSRVDVS
ncbi:glycoside hydrolase family 16 protein [Demequina sp.]|uniref:glycoside hydrolase family 16 protein n=1 Tax=Demequina sp. TaxID=2050685 RepID=UPI0025C0CEC8|nr:glycoside hydrolase family 16 protein [Demequina sp.]